MTSVRRWATVPAGGGDRLGRGRQALDVDVGGHHPGAPRRHHLGDEAPEPTGRAGDDDDLPLHVIGHGRGT